MIISTHKRTKKAGKGYWKTTEKDRVVSHRRHIVGMKKTLVYHNGHAPKGQRTNWVMHEYRLADLDLEKAGIHQVYALVVNDAFVLCRVFQKSGFGPKNGEQCGAPFVKEEWLDESEVVPKIEFAEKVDFGDVYLDGDDLEHPVDGSFVEGTIESVVDDPNLLLDAGDQHCETEQHDDNN